MIIGGSYAGLAAALALGRALRHVLIIDAGTPCNRMTPHSHNFLTRDGATPAELSGIAREQLVRYNTLTFYQGTAENAVRKPEGFEVTTQGGDIFSARKLIFATGLKDTMPDVTGFADCWGISILHCPYCHGFEVKGEPTAVWANGEAGYGFARLLSNWTNKLTLATGGPSGLSPSQHEKLQGSGIQIIEDKISAILHTGGKINQIVFESRAPLAVTVLYAKPAFEQKCVLPEKLGCQFSETGLLKTDAFQKTTVPGIWACGDNTASRSVAVAVSTGTVAGAAVNHELIEDAFS